MKRERSMKLVIAQITEAPHYFALLRVHRQSTEQELSIARRELARYVHPDVNASPKAAALMAIVNVAHHTLTTDREGYVRSLRKKPCATCKGTGTRTKQKGFTAVVQTICETCKGAGVV